MALVVRAGAAGNAVTTLDVPERQVLLRLLAQSSGCWYEHHLLLLKVSEGRWICLDSNEDVELYDMAAE